MFFVLHCCMLSHARTSVNISDVIDNFLTEAELEYFNKKISSIQFERSFVDNMAYYDDDDEANDDFSADVTAANNDEEKEETACEEKEQTGTVNTMKREESSGVNNRKTSTSENFVSNKDNESKKNKGKKGKKRKQTTLIDDSQRTSTFYSFRKLQDSRISALEQRVANILGCWVHQIEAIQLVRYLPNQFFGIHHDLGNLLEDDTVELPPKDWACKRRLVTIFCYLNTLKDDEGGM